VLYYFTAHAVQSTTIILLYSPYTYKVGAHYTTICLFRLHIIIYSYSMLHYFICVCISCRTLALGFPISILLLSFFLYIYIYDDRFNAVCKSLRESNEGAVARMLRVRAYHIIYPSRPAGVLLRPI